jgi:hypothetical protein
VNIGGPAGIQVAGATPFSPIVLSRGCNSVVITSSIGTPVANIAALVSPANAVVSIWRFNNGTKLFQAGYFADVSAPVDFSQTSGAAGSVPVGSAGILPAGGGTGTETYYVCVNQQATMISG